MESRNAKFLESDLISGSNQFENLASFDKDYLDTQTPISSERLTKVHSTSQDLMDVIQSVFNIPQAANSNLEDPVVQDTP